MLEAVTKLRAAMEASARAATAWLRAKQAACPRLLFLTDEQLALLFQLWASGDAFRAPALASCLRAMYPPLGALIWDAELRADDEGERARRPRAVAGARRLRASAAQPTSATSGRAQRPGAAPRSSIRRSTRRSAPSATGARAFGNVAAAAAAAAAADSGGGGAGAGGERLERSRARATQKRR